MSDKPLDELVEDISDLQDYVPTVRNNIRSTLNRKRATHDTLRSQKSSQG